MSPSQGVYVSARSFPRLLLTLVAVAGFVLGAIFWDLKAAFAPEADEAVVSSASDAEVPAALPSLPGHFEVNLDREQPPDQPRRYGESAPSAIPASVPAGSTSTPLTRPAQASPHEPQPQPSNIIAVNPSPSAATLEPPETGTTETSPSSSFGNCARFPFPQTLRDKGLLYFLFNFGEARESNNPSKPDTIAYMTAKSVESFRRWNPDLGFALVTNDESMCENNTLFDHILIVPQSEVDAEPGWGLRIKYMARSPFLRTLSPDSDTFNCSPVSELFSASSFDFVTGTAIPLASRESPDERVSADNSVRLYSATNRTLRFLEDWYAYHSSRQATLPKGKIYCDQRSLNEFRLLRKSALKVKFGALQCEYYTRWLPGKDEGWLWQFRRHMQTCVLNKIPVKIVHTKFARQHVCDVINEQPDRRRVSVFDATKYGKQLAEFGYHIEMVYSAEECEKYFPGFCRVWNKEPPAEMYPVAPYPLNFVDSLNLVHSHLSN
jgi:hypothetical protein